MPRFLEDRLRAQAAAKGLTGKQADRYTFGAMNNLGAMRGNKITAKGARMQAKHERDEGASSSKVKHPNRHKNLGTFLHPKKGKPIL